MIGVVALLSSAAAVASASWDWQRMRDYQKSGDRIDDVNRTQSVIRDWPRYAQDLAGAVMQEYGAPDEILVSQLRWNDRRPWKRIVVFRDARSADRPDGLLQTVAYEVPPRRASALGAFDHGVAYDPFMRELTVRSEGEATNRLALNLADEVVRERRTVTDAIAFYDKTLSLSFSGKLSPYMSGLLFQPLVAPLPERSGRAR